MLFYILLKVLSERRQDQWQHSRLFVELMVVELFSICLCDDIIVDSMSVVYGTGCY